MREGPIDTDSPNYGVLNELASMGHKDLCNTLYARDGAARLLEILPHRFAPNSVIKDGPDRRAWELCGLYYSSGNRYHEALALFEAFYFQILRYQEITSEWAHKGLPLVWTRDCHAAMGHPALAKRYAMLTLFEDAIGGNGEVPAETTGIYFRLVWGHGLSERDLKQYATRAFELYQQNPPNAWYPEWILQEVGHDWMQEYPSDSEIAYYRANPHYIRYLLNSLGEGSGRVLERLADYLLSVIPGCRTYRRRRSGSSDYDVIFTHEGHGLDFRSEWGRYSLVECKDWETPMDAGAVSRFVKKLEDARCNFGITFSREGLTGRDRGRDAKLEVFQAYQRYGRIIVVVDRKDLDRLAEGESLISLLRSRSEQVRLNLIDEAEQEKPKTSKRRRREGR